MVVARRVCRLSGTGLGLALVRAEMGAPLLRPLPFGRADRRRQHHHQPIPAAALFHRGPHLRRFADHSPTSTTPRKMRKIRKMRNILWLRSSGFESRAPHFALRGFPPDPLLTPS
eukprot:1898938-Pyramimonas_sp.AAC.2